MNQKWYVFELDGYDQLFDILIFENVNLLDEIEKMLFGRDDPILKPYTIRSIKAEVACFGCRNEKGGQKDHMEKGGGCLYTSSASSSSASSSFQ